MKSEWGKFAIALLASATVLAGCATVVEPSSSMKQQAERNSGQTNFPESRATGPVSDRLRNLMKLSVGAEPSHPVLLDEIAASIETAKSKGTFSMLKVVRSFEKSTGGVGNTDLVHRGDFSRPKKSHVIQKGWDSQSARYVYDEWIIDDGWG